MSTLLATLALSTPVWGFALQPPSLAVPSLLPETLAQVESVEAADAERPPTVSDRWLESHTTAMVNWTRALQLSATAATAAAGGVGFIQFGDEYGFNGSYEQTACANGTGVFNFCGEETPWAHALAAGTAASLLISAYAVSHAVPGDIAARRDGDWRTFETLRNVGLALALLQGVAGFFLANSTRFGWLDAQEDFDTMQALALGHMGLGLGVLGVSVANTILIF